MSKSVYFDRLARPYACTECRKEAELGIFASWTTASRHDNYEEHELIIPLCRTCFDEKVSEVRKEIEQ